MCTLLSCITIFESLHCVGDSVTRLSRTSSDKESNKLTYPSCKGHENASLLEKYEHVISILVKGRSNDINELDEYHQAEIKFLKAEHNDAMKQLRRDHDAEHQAQALELEAAQQAHQN